MESVRVLITQIDRKEWIGEKQISSGRRSLWMGENKLVRGVEVCGWQKQISSGRRSLWTAKNKLVRGAEALGSPKISFHKSVLCSPRMMRTQATSFLALYRLELLAPV